jgi:hypothetical protein
VIVSVLDPAEAASRLAARRRGLAMGESRPADVAARAEEWRPWAEAHLVLDAAVDAGRMRSQAVAWLLDG